MLDIEVKCLTKHVSNVYVLFTCFRTVLIYDLDELKKVYPI